MPAVIVIRALSMIQVGVSQNCFSGWTKVNWKVSLYFKLT